MKKISIPGYKTYSSGNTTLILSNDFKKDAIPDTGPIGLVSSLKGRTRIRLLGNSMAVRELSHGGLLGKITARRFLSPMRSIRELKISSRLRENGINTPEIVAVRFIKKGVFYKIDVVTKLIPDSIDLLEWLKINRNAHSETSRFSQHHGQDRIFNAVFEETGRLVRSIHDWHVFHADLHLKNILIDSDMKPWIIDLDKSFRLLPLPRFLKEMNIRRFFRSCRKWSENGTISFNEDYQKIFLKGYNRT